MKYCFITSTIIILNASSYNKFNYWCHNDKIGRLDSGFRELAVAIIMSSRGEQRISF